MKRVLCFSLAVLLTIPFMGCAAAQKQPDKNKDVTQVINNNGEKLNVETPEENYKQLFGDVKIKTIRAVLPDGRPWSERDISDKGEIFGFVPRINGKPGQIIIYDLNTGAVQNIYSIKDDASLSYLKYNDDYLVWTETINNYDQRESKVVVYDKKNKKSTVLSEKKKIPAQISDEMIALGSDYVLWSTSALEKENVKHMIMKYDLKNQKTTVFKETAGMPIIGKDFIAWLGPEDEKMTNSAIYLNNPKDNTVEKIITKGQHPTYIDTDGTSIVFNGVKDTTDNDPKAPSTKMLSIYEKGKIQIIKESITDNLEFPEVSQNFVGWRGTTTLSVYSRKDDKIGILTEEFADYTEAKVCNKYIMWHSPAIKDEHEAKRKAVEQHIYLSDLHIISKDDMVK